MSDERYNQAPKAPLPLFVVLRPASGRPVDLEDIPPIMRSLEITFSALMTRISEIGEDKFRDRPLPHDPHLRSEEWLRLAAEVAQMGLWYWNEVTTELFWDKKTREMFGVNLVGEVTVGCYKKHCTMRRSTAVWNGSKCN